jgi:hypothetical protein
MKMTGKPIRKERRQPEEELFLTTKSWARRLKKLLLITFRLSCKKSAMITFRLSCKKSAMISQIRDAQNIKKMILRRIRMITKLK